MFDVLQKLRLKFLYRLSQLIAVKPFLKIDTDSYCPACGHENGKIRAAVLQSPDPSGSKIGIHHQCGVCGYQWVEPAVSIITHHILEEPDVRDEQQAINVLQADKRTKNIRNPEKKVNGQLVS